LGGLASLLYFPSLSKSYSEKHGVTRTKMLFVIIGLDFCRFPSTAVLCRM